MAHVPPIIPDAGGASVCAIVVTYRPDQDLPARLEHIRRQVGALVIVDNGSAVDAVAMLRGIAREPGVHLVLNEDNFGIARALNIGIGRAAALGFGRVLLLDQDSCVEHDMVRELLAVEASHPEGGRLAVIGAAFMDVNRESRGIRTQQSADPAESAAPAWQDAEFVITSGSLIPLAVHEIVGPFREELFIDSVDIDYCFRARRMGYRLIKTRRFLMSHAIGAYSRHRVLGKDKWTTNHSADRRYYIARNDTVMLREYGNYRFGLWALKGFQRSFRLCKRILLYEVSKGPKLIAVIQGWWDAVRGRLGPRTRSHDLR